ncbi:hypothetical protein M409DRAFT_49609 [Zasmidium cellare ATCC 36951]|uniref:Uncharacterized protein n=1 Tax=Zasmidium cellare ATCC 36951 TaxID=1080233 RepID=A0A6A6D180_ZASCE|nr:uncharacterized protein M409DRAFT_49609 [Zasmidium cellare ATCC 36951]KAF2173121.1 hypothetical protein M409DRAFT_49609 [Zasmidium cellare ATCC 36951]
MARPEQDTLTPIRIRGKRRGTPAEKWHYGKRRNPQLQKRRTPLDQTMSGTTPATSPTRPRKRRRRDTAESPLERLPAEVTQIIFEYSANIELPLTSRALALTLSKSQHLQHQLTTETLQPVLGNTATPTKAELCRATRLLNSRFVTWPFFRAWLRSHVAAHSQPSGDSGESSDDLDHAIRLWASLGPSPSLLPPKKLLDPVNGFTQECCTLLAVLAHSVRDLPRKDPAYGELAYEGLIKAIKTEHEDVVSLMLRMGVVASTETLRMAVTEGGCNEDIVRMLLYRPSRNQQTHLSSSRSETEGDGEGTLDLLDPEIWAWAEEAQKQGSRRKGEWLVAELRYAQQRRSESET